MYLGNIIPLNGIDKKKIIIIIVVLLLLIGNIGFGIGYFSEMFEIQKIRKELKVQRLNVRVINFSNLFIGQRAFNN